MDLNATLDIIIRDLEETRKIIDDLKGYQGVPFLQIELAKSKCKSAAEMIALLKDLPGDNEMIFRSVIQEKPKEKPAEPGIVTEDRGISYYAPEVNGDTVKAREEVSENIIRASKEVSEDIFTAPQAVREDNIKAPKAVQESSILADQFSDMPESFNEKLSSLKHDEGVIDMLKSKPVSNLGEAIGINDKFLFIREIFNGSLESYNTTISRLETAATFGEAREIIGGLTGNMENEAVKQLTDLLKRKFPSDE
jgi:hypothetical protein